MIKKILGIMDSSLINGAFFVQKMQQIQDRFPGRRIIVYYDSRSLPEDMDGVVVLPLPIGVISLTNSGVGFERELINLWNFNDDIVVLYLDGEHNLEHRLVPCRQYIYMKIATMLLMGQHTDDYWRDKIAFYEFKCPTWI